MMRVRVPCKTSFVKTAVCKPIQPPSKHQYYFPIKAEPAGNRSS